MTDRPALTCPYCGAEMELEDYGEFYKCVKCLSTSPWMEDRSTAYAAAMARYVEANRVLTLEEAYVWLNDRADASNPVIWVETRDGAYNWAKDGWNQRAVCRCRFITLDYGIQFRYRLRRPTDEEREAVPWG